MTGAIVDLFRGAGGWEARLPEPLRKRMIGVDFDEQATATAIRNGLTAIRADIAALDPRAVVESGSAAGLIASPPCPTFSSAGKGGGRILIPWLLGNVAPVLDGNAIPSVPEEQLRDDALARAHAAAGRKPIDAGKVVDAAHEEAVKTYLTLEPARWVAALDPGWILLEQVPPVLPIWKALGRELEKRGYRVWAGLLRAEEYGVPQTRTRAILIARKGAPARPPTPTHHRYVSGAARPATSDDLFGDSLQTWVSMAEALGWENGIVPRPSPTVTGGGTGSGGGVEVYAGVDEREKARLAVGFPRRADTDTNKTAGVVEIDGEEYRERDLRDADAPAQHVTEKARDWRVYELRGDQTVRAGERGGEIATRDVDDPSLTVGTTASAWRWNGEDAPAEEAERVVGYDRRAGALDDPQAPVRPLDEPAPTITAAGTGGGEGGPTHVWTTGQKHVQARELDEPAPTLTGAGIPKGREGWAEPDDPRVERGARVRTGNFTAKNRDADGARSAAGSEPYERSVEEPAPTVTGGLTGWSIDGPGPRERPATTVAADARVHPPGHKENASDPEGVYEQRRGSNAIRVTVRQAARLQSFPDSWVFLGTRTRKFLQVGNAVPSLLAWHLLRVVEPASFAGLEPDDLRHLPPAPATDPETT